jgi:alanine racemase
MNPLPNHSLRWVEISRSGVAAALDGSSSLDIRSDAYGFGGQLVSRVALEAGLSVDGTDRDWADRAHASQAQRLCALVINVKHIPAGEEVSYGGHFRTERPTTLALVAAGFADGVPRLDPTGGMVEIAGERCPIAGRIAMDQLIVDVTGLSVSVGDVATIWGGAVSIDEWSQWSGRGVREIGSSLAPRVTRVEVA